MTVGERIRAARKAKGLTQKALGEACGIAEPTIRRYELGKLNPKYETLEKIASALGLSASELMGIGLLPVELMLEKYREREAEARELGLGPPSPALEAALGRISQGGVANEDVEALGDVQSLSAVRRCLEELGFFELHGGGPETAALVNRRTRLVYIVSYDRYLEAMEAVLRSIKQEMSALLEGAGEALGYEEANSRGYEDMMGVLEGTDKL